MGSKIYVKGFDELEYALADTGKRVTPLMKQAVYAAAGVVADNVRASLNAAVSDEATGELADCININKIGAKDGNVYTSVGFDGYLKSNGSPAPLVANVLESGRSDQPGRKKTHFFSRAVRRAQSAALAAASLKIYEVLQKELGE